MTAMFSVGPAICVWLLLVSLSAVHAQVVHDLRKLINSSDLVAVARVTAVNQTGSAAIEVQRGQFIPAHFRVAVLHLQAILKGEPAAEDLIVRYSILYSSGGWGGGVPNGYTVRDTLILNSTRLIFLRNMGDRYELTNGADVSLVCAPEPSSGDRSPDTWSRVLSRLTDAIFSPNVSEPDKAEAIRQLGAVDTGTVVPALRIFIASDAHCHDEFLRREALVALLDHKDESAVRSAESELRSGSASSWKSNLIFALARAVPPSRSIPTLAEALALPSPEVQVSVAIAIYQIDSPEGIPPLLQALDDPDPQVAFAVMQGLGNLTKDYKWRPKSTEPDADWFRCLNHWHVFRQRWNRGR